MIEEWKDIKDYEGLYQVSNFGRVKSLERYKNNPLHGVVKIKEIMLSTVITSGIDGHFVVNLSKNGKAKPKKVHKLVAQAFIPNPENKPYVHHIDHNKENNKVDNLMWVTPKEHNELHSENIKKAFIVAHEKRSKPIIQCSKNGKFIKEYQSIMEAERQTGIKNTNISSCCIGKRKTAGGFVWKYK